MVAQLYGIMVKSMLKIPKSLILLLPIFNVCVFCHLS